MGHNDLGHHHYSVGNLNEALKCYMRTRDYGTTPKHQIEMCLNIIKVGIEMNNYSHVVNHINKAEQSTEALEPTVVAKLRASSGLAHLDSGKFKQAALRFVSMRCEVGKGENNQVFLLVNHIFAEHACLSNYCPLNLLLAHIHL